MSRNQGLIRKRNNFAFCKVLMIIDNFKMIFPFIAKHSLKLFLALCLLISACDKDILKADDYSSALDAYAERNLPLAERLLERCLREEQDPEKRWLAWNLLLKAINADRSHPRATIECLDAMLVEYGDEPAKQAQLYPLIAKNNFALRNFDLAASAWSAWLELGDIDDVQRVEGYRQLAAMQFAQRHYEAAEETLQQCLALPAPDKDKIACMLDLAEENMMREHWAEVADLCQQIIDLDPDKEIFGKASYLRGDALEQMGKKDEALEVFERARDKYPNPMVMDNRIAHLKKKDSR